MSFVTKKPFTTSCRKMVVRRQISDMISYGQIITTKCHAKYTQIFLEKLITSSKEDNLISRRKAHSILLRTKNYTKDELVQKLFHEIAKKYKTRPGGYTRLLKTENGSLLQLV